MLTHLHIQGLAVIDSLSIDFDCGLNVITGETGAGKSILIKALGLLFGAKASSEALRAGCSEALISGSFQVDERHAAIELLKNLAVPLGPEDDGATILLRRQITIKGKSNAWINDTPVTISTLKEVAEKLVDIFGQHENQKLLDAHQHIHFLDDFISNPKILSDYQSQYLSALDQLKTLRAELESFQKTSGNKDYYQFRLDELEKFAPDKNDFDTVLSLCKNSRSVAALQKNLENATDILERSSDGGSLSAQLWQVARLLGKIESPPHLKEPIDSLSQRSASLAEEVDALAFSLSKVGSSLEFSEEDLEEAQTRLAGYQALFRKFSVLDAEALLAEQSRLKLEMDKLNHFSRHVESALKQIRSLTHKLPTLAQALTRERQKASETVKLKIEKELSELAMPGARLDVEFLPISKTLLALELPIELETARDDLSEIFQTLSELSENGREKIQFLLSSNAGEAFYPLQKIASGGEVSRIMLAFKRVLSLQADSCLLVFDEIDTGISGKTAAVVGKKIRQLASKFQVLCISHLPQVAAFADNHFRVEKFKHKDRTESRIVKMDKKQSLEEIARLLSGTEVTKQSLANAKTLLERAQG